MTPKFVSYLTPFLTCSISFAQLSFYDLEASYTGTGHPNQVTFVLSYDLDKDGIEDLLHIQGNELFVKRQENEIYLDEEVVYTHTSDFFNFSNKGDLNDDGIDDFVINTENSILVFLGTTESIELVDEIDANSPQHSFLVDLNNDDHVDIVYNSSDGISPYVNELYFIERNGDGSFKAESSLTESIDEIDRIYRFKIVDIEKDGDLDLLILEFGGLHVVENDQFDFTLHSSIEVPNTSFFNLEFGDFNLDGLIDVVLTDHENNLIIYTNRSTLFEESYRYSTINLTSVISVDYDLNGRIDLLVSDFHNRLTFLSNNGDETFESSVSVNGSIPKIINPSLSDFNNDGNLDIVAIGNIQTGGQRAVLIPLDPLVNVNNPFISISLRPYPASSDGTQLGDMDNDGYEDLVIFSRNGAIQIFYGKEGGFNSDYQSLASHTFTSGGFIRDVDSDGDLDMIIRKHSPNNGTNGTDIIYNNSNREYQDFQSYKYLPNPTNISFVDIDNDGTMNLASFMSFGQEVVFLEPNDNLDEYFDASVPRISTDDRIKDVLYTDVDNDSWIDVVVAVDNSNQIEIHTNDQMGGFNDPTFINLASEEEATALAFEDLDGDLLKDFIIATTNSSSDPKLKMLKRPDISSPFVLDKEFVIETFSGASDIIIDDYDNDGEKDFYLKNTPGFYSSTGEQNSNYINIFSPTDFGSFQIFFQDFNSDGLKDFVRIRRSSATTMISLNNTVSKPEVASTIASVSHTEPGSATLTMSDETYSGRLVLIGSGVDSGIPQDGIFYASNPKVGVGSQIDDAFVLHTGSDEEVVITDLAPQVKYFLRIFEFNTNEPENSIINYRTSSFTTVDFNSKDSQILSYPDLRTHVSDEQTFEVVINSSSELPVSLELVSGSITLEDNIATITGLGTIVIRASQDGDEAYFSAEEEYEFEIVEALSAGDIDQNFIISPNPFESTFTIDLLPSTNDVVYQILEISGKVIREGALRKSRQIDMTGSKSGVYMLKYMQDGKSYSRSIIKR